MTEGLVRNNDDDALPLILNTGTRGQTGTTVSQLTWLDCFIDPRFWTVSNNRVAVGGNVVLHLLCRLARVSFVLRINQSGHVRGAINGKIVTDGQIELFMGFQSIIPRTRMTDHPRRCWDSGWWLCEIVDTRELTIVEFFIRFVIYGRTTKTCRKTMSFHT